MAEQHCPHCGKPLRVVRLGTIRLTILKARIFDAIAAAGPHGIDGNELYLLIFPERKVQRVTLKTHVDQINELLVETDYRIDGVRRTGGMFILARRDAPIPNVSRRRPPGPLAPPRDHALARAIGRIGGRARAAKLSPEQRSAISKIGANARHRGRQE